MPVQKTVWVSGPAPALDGLQPTLRSVPMTWTLPAHPAAVPAARAFVLKHLAGLLTSETCADAVLVTSELVANAVAASATGSAIELTVAVDEDSARIEVFDRSEDVPQRRCADDFDEGGRGLLLVEGLARQWGWRLVSDGKVVWAAL